MRDHYSTVMTEARSAIHGLMIRRRRLFNFIKIERKRNMTTADLPPIPIPPRLPELLKDYPELLDEIRQTLDSYLRRPMYTQPLDGALWLLEDTLSAFISRARGEADHAEASGDAGAIAKAKAKVSLMFSAHSKNNGLKDINNICDYFEEHDEAFS